MNDESKTHPLAGPIRQAGRECGDIETAGRRLGLDDLGALLGDDAELRQAWERGRFLRRLRELAEGPICLAVCAERLGMDEGAFRALLETDPEARDIWQQGRHTFFLRGKAAIMRGAEEGKPHGLKMVERLLQAEAGVSDAPERIDFRRLLPKEMSEAVGIDHHQMNRWSKEHGLPRGMDGSYSLPAFVAWLRTSPLRPKRPYRRKPAAIAKRLLARIESVVNEELGGIAPEAGQDDE
ncbi:MAG: hypothetical protein RBR19_14425 [Sedimentisphaerales bacterium]|jgi:hypothetical protein|nr:hypothetical protein [Sedimentisphaerales bacterium]